jgi:hypothetical protein
LSYDFASWEMTSVLANPLLLSEMSPDPAWEAAFDQRYDQEPIPARMAAQRWFSEQYNVFDRHRTRQKAVI